MLDEFDTIRFGIKKAISPEAKKITLEDLDFRISALEEILGNIGKLLPRSNIVPLTVKKRKISAQ